MSRIIFGAFSSAILLAAPFLAPVLFPAAWLAFVPLFWAIARAKNLRGAVFYGWLAGFVAHLVGFYWLVYTINVFGGFPYPVSAVVFLIYAALQGLQMAIFAFLVRGIGFGPWQIFPALFWVSIEFLFPLLFPWHLANSQSSFAWFIQTADLAGLYATSFLLMWFNAIVAGVLFKKERGAKAQWVPVAVCSACIIASLIYGWVRLNQLTAQMKTAAKLTVAAVQGNIAVDMKWDPKQMNANLDAHIKLTQEISGVQVIMWPESSIEEWLPENLSALPAQFVESLRLKNAYFIFGARSYRGNPKGPDPKAFNTAFLTDPRGVVLGRYHKQVLLAFGEYVPFSGLLGLLPGIPFVEGFTAGDGPRTLDLPAGEKIAPLICYEDLMPEISRSFVREKKANLLVNLTNDAWYGRTVAPWQHARLAQWRAIETRRSLLRVTNTGVTSLINAKGEMVETLPIFTPAALKTQLEILETETLYVRFGDWFAWGITLIAVAIVLSHFSRRRIDRNSH
ncbi:MAG TPA: apolipoprotein N-acyltransferase [Candidatus Binatia bacterium]|nr:apolipoprotein N-acyltransferase [Candidatus Binatia bacterium]